jgi:hypothetical protein
MREGSSIMSYVIKDCKDFIGTVQDFIGTVQAHQPLIILLIIFLIIVCTISVIDTHMYRKKKHTRQDKDRHHP